MRNRMWVIGCLGLTLWAGGRAWAAADIPVSERAEVAKTAELKGDLARAHQNYGLAAAYYHDALKAAPTNSILANKMGMAFLQAGDRGAAKKAFKQAVKLNPRFADAYNNLGAVACIERKYNPAVHYLKQALALDENMASAHLNMAEAWAGLSNMDRAMTEYARALELDADILSTEGNGVLIQLSTPEQRGRVDLLIAKAYVKRGNVEGALEYLQRAKDNHCNELSKVYEDATFSPLWNDARLAKIVKRPG